MRSLIFFTLTVLTQLSFSQDRSKVDFQQDINSVTVTLDGKKLFINTTRWNPKAYGPYVRDYLIYDFQSRSVRMFKEAGPFGGLSPNGRYFLTTKLRFMDMKRSPYKTTLVDLETGEQKVWEDEHFGLAVYDDGHVLATKAKNRKSIARVEEFKTLYLYNPDGEGKARELIDKKESLEKDAYLSAENVPANPEFFQLLSPDQLSSWGGDLINNSRYPQFDLFDLKTGAKTEFVIRFPDDTTSLPTNQILAVEGKNAILRRESRKNKGQWTDYFVNAGTGEKQGIANQDTHTTPAQYQLLNGKVYQFDNSGTLVTRFETSSGKAISDKVWYPKIPRAMLTEEKYKYAIASDKYLVIVPSERTGRTAEMLIYDLTTNAVVDNFILYKKDKPKTVASASAPAKKLYKSNLLNSYDRMSLPYTVRNPSGREVTGLSGASSIGRGQVFAIGMIGTTANKNPILLSLTRYTASNGSQVSTYYVSVFDENGVHQRTKEIGTVQRSSSGRTFAVVNFKIQREQYNTFTIVGEQQFEQRKTPFKLTIEPSGNIH
jgi:hypothetical protein